MSFPFRFYDNSHKSYNWQSPITNIYHQITIIAGYSCNAHEFRCSDGLCIKAERLCDGIYHCADKSDELEQNCKDIDNGTDNRIIGNIHSNISVKTIFSFCHIACVTNMAVLHEKTIPFFACAFFMEHFNC